MATSRWALAPLLAGAVAIAQLLLAQVFAFVPVGARAAGIGVSLTTALLIAAGYVAGRASRPTERDGRAGVLPWMVLLLTSVLLAAFGGALGWTPAGELFPGRQMGSGGILRAMLTTDAVMFPGVALLNLGTQLGLRGRPRSVAFGTLGSLLILGIVAVAFELARGVWVDPAAIRGWTAAAGVLAVLITGFGLAWARRSIAIVEMTWTALLTGYALYIGVAAGPEALISAWSLPIEQILLALSVVPTVGILALLAVGGSLGFLLFGSGHLDAGFGYEVQVAMRYLQVNLQGTSRLVYSGFFALLVFAASLGAGLWGYGMGGPAEAAGFGLSVWALAFGLRALLGGWWLKGAVTLGLLGASGLAYIAFGASSLALGAGLASLAAILRFGPRPQRALRQSPFVGVVTVISVVGVGLGVLAQVVVLSVMSGFENDLKSKILGAHAHVVVEKYGDDFAEYTGVEKRARKVAGVHTAAAFVLGDAMMSTDVGLSGTLVKGVDPGSEDAVGELRSNLERGRVEYLVEPSKIPGGCGRTPFPPRPTPPKKTEEGAAGPLPLDAVASGGSARCAGRVLPGVIIGKELSRTLRAYVGDVVKLVSPVSEELGPLGPTPKLRRFRVAGIFYSGMYEYDAKLAYVSIKEAQKFFGKRGRASGVELKIEDIESSGLVVKSLELGLGGEPYRVKDWRDMNKELFSALLLEKMAMFVALAMIITVASFLIVATLVMIVLQRGREIAILKSMGASESSILKVFVVQGVVVGVGGALLGVALGVTICSLLQNVGLRLDERVFYIERLPVVVDGVEVAVIAISAMIITYLATIYPAMSAAVLRPVDGLREE
ncbi:MAG: ABC transporter permease [Myxococcota bacterium]